MFIRVGVEWDRHPQTLTDTFYAAWIKGIGKIYQQTGIDTFSNIAFAKVYTEKTALTATDFLNDRILPFFDGHGIRLLRTLTDRGTEYCGVQDQHPCELFCYLNDIEHSRTKARHPQTNGACILNMIREEAKHKGLPYQTYINQLLREHVAGDEEKKIRAIVRDEVRKIAK
jgi:hypothetical protein